MEEREGGMKNEYREREKERGEMCEFTEERRERKKEKNWTYLKEGER